MPDLFAASNHRQLGVSPSPAPLLFEGSHRRHGVVTIVAPAFPANAAGSVLSLYQDTVLHPVGPELLQWSHSHPSIPLCSKNFKYSLTSLRPRQFVECSDGRYGGMAVDAVVRIDAYTPPFGYLS